MTRLNPSSAKLRPWHFQLLLWSLLALWGTGLGWLWLHHFLQVEGDFGPSPHPLEPWMLRLHGFFMFPALLAIGGLIAAHLTTGWRYRHKRASGLVQGALYLTLILTGYALYYSGGELLRAVASLVHWIVGAGAPVSFIWHLTAKAKRP